MENSNKKGFLAMNAGVDVTPTGKDTPYAFHVDGIVSTEPAYHEGKDGKKGLLILNVVVGRNPWQMLGEDEVKAQANNPNVNADRPFVSVCVFSPRAEELKDRLTKGSKVSFSGRVDKNVYTRQSDQTQIETVRVYADVIYPISCRATAGGTPTNTINHVTQKYTRRDGTEGTANMGTLVAGTVKSAGSVREVNGQSVVSFELELPVAALLCEAIINGTYQKGTDYGNYKVVSCSVWGPRAQHLSRVLTEGNTLLVTGTASQRDYNGQKYVNMTVRDITVMSWNNAAASAAPANVPASTAPAPNPAPANAPASADVAGDDLGDLGSLMDDDGDYELPF